MYMPFAENLLLDAIAQCEPGDTIPLEQVLSDLRRE